MTITDIKFRKVFNNDILKAIVSIVLENCIAVHDIKIIQCNNKLFVAMSTHEDINGVLTDIIQPMCSETKAKLETEILEAYEKHNALTTVIRRHYK